MRYIYYIILILLVLSALIGYLLMPPPIHEKKAALVINGKIITSDDFDRLYAPQRGLSDRDAFIDSLVTRELLIQESRKEGIDREEPFRNSIRNFYEQSLIKLLMDRKFASFHPDVTDEEVDRYVAFFGKKLLLTIYRFSNLREAEKGGLKSGEKRTLSLDELSPGLRAPVAALRAGGITRPIRSGGNYLVVRLDGIEGVSPAAQAPDREEVRKMLAGEKKEEMVNGWIADLRKKAAVQILMKK